MVNKFKWNLLYDYKIDLNLSFNIYLIMVNFVVLLSDGDIKDININLKADDRNKPFKS